jgi:chromosome segregation ATPase
MPSTDRGVTSHAQSQNDDQIDTLADLRRRLTETEAQRDCALERLEHCRATQESLEHSVDLLQRQNRSLAEGLVSRDAAVDELRARCADLDLQVNAANVEKEACRNTADLATRSLMKKIDDLECRLKQKELDLRKSRRVIDEFLLNWFIARDQELSNAVGILQQNLTNSEQTRRQLEHHIDEITSRLHELQRENETAKQIVSRAELHHHAEIGLMQGKLQAALTAVAAAEETFLKSQTWTESKLLAATTAYRQSIEENRILSASCRALFATVKKLAERRNPTVPRAVLDAQERVKAIEYVTHQDQVQFEISERRDDVSKNVESLSCEPAPAEPGRSAPQVADRPPTQSLLDDVLYYSAAA